MMSNLKFFFGSLLFNWVAMIIILIVLVVGGIKIGKYISYKLYYQSYVKEAIEPLKKRIERLEFLMTNGPVQLQ